MVTEGRGSAEYEDNRFMINPNMSILGNMLFITDQYISRKLVGGFKLTEMANQLMNEGRIDDELLYPFEDVTWDTVFGNLKCIEFYNFGSNPESARGVENYINFLDYIHNTDTTNFIDDTKTDTSQMLGLMMSEVWAEVKQGIIELLENDSFDRNELIERALKTMMDSFYKTIDEYFSSSYLDEAEGEHLFMNIFAGMQDVINDMAFDENTLVKTTYASIVKGAEVLICNPEYLPFGERLASASRYFMAGSSLLVSEKFMTSMGDSLDKLREKYGDEIVTLLPALISSTICCACLVSLDHNPMIQELIARFNEVPTLTYEIRQLKESAEQFERIAAELGSYDYDKLKIEIDAYSAMAEDILVIDSPEALNDYLMKYYEKTGKPIPWGNRTVEEHWADPNSRLVFE